MGRFILKTFFTLGGKLLMNNYVFSCSDKPEVEPEVGSVKAI